MNHHRAAAVTAGMVGAALALTVLVAPAVGAYTVTSPNVNEGWRAQSPGHISWSRADTDPTSFDVVLTRNQPPFSSVIARQVNGRSSSYVIPPPRGGFPAGEHFRIDFVDPNTHNTIYAQSNEFIIRP